MFLTETVILSSAAILHMQLLLCFIKNTADTACFQWRYKTQLNYFTKYSVVIRVISGNVPGRKDVSPSQKEAKKVYPEPMGNLISLTFSWEIMQCPESMYWKAIKASTYPLSVFLMSFELFRGDLSMIYAGSYPSDFMS